MNIGKTLALTAVTVMLAGVMGGCGGDAKADAKSPTTEAAPGGDKNCCKGKNECKGKSGCKSDKSACAGQNACKGQGTSCPKG